MNQAPPTTTGFGQASIYSAKRILIYLHSGNVLLSYLRLRWPSVSAGIPVREPVRGASQQFKAQV
jgi:hypothetical protein